jgi:hypothetical protein
MVDIAHFEKLRRDGASSAEVVRTARHMGLGEIEIIRVLRAVFALELGAAKEALITSRGTTISEHETWVLSAVEEGLSLGVGEAEYDDELDE